jgi:hypothetical protein
MLGDESVDLILHDLRQRVVSGAHIGEFSLATPERACRRHCDRVQHPEYHRHRQIGGIGMPNAVAEEVEAPAVIAVAQLATLVEFEISPISGKASRLLPPSVADRPISSWPNLPAKSRNCSSLSC